MASSASDGTFSSTTSDVDEAKDEPRKKKIKFTCHQVSRLQAMYACGTRGTGKMDLPSIKKAATDTGLQIAQIKVTRRERLLMS